MNIQGLVFHSPNNVAKFVVRFEAILDDYVPGANSCFEAAFDHVSTPISPMGEWIVVGADDYLIVPTIVPDDPDNIDSTRSRSTFSNEELHELKSLLERMVNQSLEMAKNQRSKFDLKVRNP